MVEKSDAYIALETELHRQMLLRENAEKKLLEKEQKLKDTTTALKRANARIEDLVALKDPILKTLFDHLADAYVLMDLKGNTLKMNTQARDLLEFYDTDTTLYLPALLHPLDIAYTASCFTDLVTKGFITDYQVRIITPSNTIKRIHVNGSILYDIHKNPIAAQGIVRDITKETEIQELFEEQKKQLHIILDNSPLGIALISKGFFVKTNKRLQELLDYTEQDLKALKFRDLIFSEDVAAFLDLTRRMRAAEIDSFFMHCKYLKKDGSILISKTTVNVVKDSKGDIKHQVAVVEDITNEIKESAALAGLNKLMESLLGKSDIQQLGEEIVQKTVELFGFQDCVIYFLNRQKKILEPIAAYNPKGVSFKDRLIPSTIAFGYGIIGNVAQTGVPEVIPDTSKDSRYVVYGRKRLSEITVPIIADDEVIGIIDSEHISKNYYTDFHLKTLTNIANAVALQLKHAINLEQKLKIEQQKEVLLKSLERSNASLKEYAHVVSHDLKSPLRSIYALVSWLKEDYVALYDTKALETFSMLEKKLEQMDHLIDGILKYSSIHADKALVRHKVDVQVLVEDLLETIFIPQHVAVTIANPLPIIMAETTRIKQLFQNLLTNAVSHIEKKQGRVSISSHQDIDFWYFSIADNGIGIAKEYHQKIFEIFQSLDTKKESTGIGLSIVKKIVDLYKGQICLDSAPGKGTTFYFSIKKH